MKVKTGEFVNVLKKIYALVSNSNLMEELRVFFIVPDLETKTLSISGTDSTMTIIEKVPYEPTENSDDTRIVLDANKLFAILKNSTDLEFVEFTYDEDAPFVEISIGNATVKLRKLLDNSRELVNFSIADGVTFDDDFTVSEVKNILGNILKIVDSTNTELSSRTLFVYDGKVVLGDDTFISYQEFKSSGSYNIPDKVVKLLNTVMNGLPLDSKVHFKNFGNNQVLVKTEVGTLLFQELDVAMPDLEVLDDFTSTNSLKVDKSELLKAISLVAATANEHGILLEWTPDGLLQLQTVSEEESSVIRLKSLESPLNTYNKESSFCIVPLKLFVKFIKAVLGQEVVLSIDDEYSMLQIKNEKDGITSTLSVLLPEEIDGWIQN